VTTKLRDPMQYQALTIIGVIPDIPKKEIAIAFRGDPNEEEHDMIVVAPAGIVAALVISLHDACRKIDAYSQDKAGLAQPIQVTGADVANPVMGHCAVMLRAGGFQLPAMMTKEAALQTIAAIQQAVELLDLPPSIPKQLS